MRSIEKDIKEGRGVPPNYLEILGNTKEYKNPMSEKLTAERVDNLLKDINQEKIISISKSAFDIGYEGDSPEDYVRKKKRRNNLNRPSFN